MVVTIERTMLPTLAILSLASAVLSQMEEELSTLESIPEAAVWCGERKVRFGIRFGFSILALLLTSSPSV